MIKLAAFAVITLNSVYAGRLGMAGFVIDQRDLDCVAKNNLTVRIIPWDTNPLKRCLRSYPSPRPATYSYCDSHPGSNSNLRIVHVKRDLYAIKSADFKNHLRADTPPKPILWVPQRFSWEMFQFVHRDDLFSNLGWHIKAAFHPAGHYLGWQMGSLHKNTRFFSSRESISRHRCSDRS